jgi:ABC-type antimicrobial peptide transport system permease subunit
MMSGTFVLTDTIDKAFSTIFDQSYAGTDAVVSGKGLSISFQGDSTADPPVDARLLDEIRALPSVALAMGGVYDETNTKIIGEDGKAVDTGGAPSFGFGIDTSPELSVFNPLSLLEGRWPERPNEIVLDAGVVDRENFELGDTIQVSTLEPKQPFDLVGVAQYGDVKTLGTSTFVIFDVASAQRLFDREGQFDAISVAAKEGVSADELRRDIQPILPADAQVKTGATEAQEQKDEISEFTTFIRYFLLAFAGIALFVGSFVIFNTLSITVAQRTREFATLRTLGASRRQVRGSVLLEALVIGLFASLVGLVLGLGLAKGLQALFRGLGFELPQAGTVFALRTVIVSLLVGTGITVVAGMFPAIRATRVPPIAAVREGATLPHGRFSRFSPYVALVLIALALAALGYSMFGSNIDIVQRLLAIAAGVLLLFVGVAMISSRAVRPIARLVHPIGKWAVVVLSILFYPVTLAYWLLRYGAFSTGRPPGKRLAAAAGGLVLSLAYFGVLTYTTLGPGAVVVGLVPAAIVLVLWVRAKVTRFRPEWPVELPGVRPERTASSIGRENARRNPGRTAATAAALMIGVALVAFVATLTNGMRASNREAIEEQIAADFIVTSQDGYTPFVAAAGDAAAEAPSAEVVTHVRSDLAEFEGHSGYLTGIDPELITQGYNFDWFDGSDATLATLGVNGAIVDEKFAEDHGFRVGSPIEVRTVTGRMQAEIKGIYTPPPFYPLLGSVSIPTPAFDALVDRPRNQYTFVNFPGEPDEAGRRELEQATSGFPDARVQTRQEWIDKEDEEFAQFLTMLYVLLALSVIVSLFGMVNTLVLSVFERTRELGMLRAVGMTRRQVRRMIRHESVITSLIGAALGLPLGIFLAALVTAALSTYNVRFSIPAFQLVVLGVLAVVVGLFAAIAPARRAARLNPLEALHYE